MLALLSPDMTVTTFPTGAYVCQCPEHHPLAPDDAPLADVYLRISQDRTGEHLGVDRQLPPVCKMLNGAGYRIGRVWVDNDKSATTGVYRPAFEGLLKASPKVVGVWHTDRFVRLSKELERIIEAEMTVLAATAGFFDLSNPAGQAMAKTVTAWAEYEGKQKVLRQKNANLQRAQMGKHWWTRRPFGFNMDGTHIPEEAEAVKKLYGDFLLGSNLSELARWLNSSGFRTSTYKSREGEIKGGKEWSTPALKYLLESARNAGVRTYNGEEVGPAGWEPIVPEEVWRATAYKLRDKSRRTNHVSRGRGVHNLLSQIALCGVCGLHVKVSTVSRKGRDNDRYYTCSGPQKHIAHSVEWADSVVLRKIIGLSQDPRYLALWSTRPVTNPAEVEALRVEEAACRERLAEADEDRAAGLISRQSHLVMHKRNNERLEQIERELAEIGSQTQLSVILADLDLTWQGVEDMTLMRRRQLVTQILAKITLMPLGQGSRTRSQSSIVMEERTPDAEDFAA